MLQMIEANWIVLVLALVIGVLVAWWVFVGTRRTRVEIEPAEEETGRTAARRNQALIDAPPASATPATSAPTAPLAAPPDAVAMPPATPMGLGGIGEVVQAAAEPARVPEPVAPPEEAAPPPPMIPPPPVGQSGDDLTAIKGLGPKLAAQLRELGVTSLAQIAAWDEAEIDRIDAQLGRFQGRIRRDQWPEQARLLAAGDKAAYAQRFGNL